MARNAEGHAGAMKLPILLLLAVSAQAWPHITQRGLTEAASISTVAINVLEIKATVTKARAAAKTVKVTTVKAAKAVGKKIGGK